MWETSTSCRKQDARSLLLFSYLVFFGEKAVFYRCLCYSSYFHCIQFRDVFQWKKNMDDFVSFLRISLFTAAYVMYRIPIAYISGMFSYEKLYGQFPDFSLVRVFGCTCFVLRPYAWEQNKLFPKSALCCVYFWYTILVRKDIGVLI